LGVADTDEPNYIWSEEPAGWGRTERARFDGMFYTFSGGERVESALAAFRDARNDVDSNTVLVEVATLLASKGFGQRRRVRGRHSVHD